MTSKALQDCLPKGSPFRECFGCGADNPQGLRIKSYLEGDRAVCRFRPEAHHLAAPGMVNGGILATLIDCHGIWTAVGLSLRKEGASAGQDTSGVFVTRKLTVEYLKPAPTGLEIVLVGKITAQSQRSVTVTVDLSAGDETVARGEVVAVRVM